MLRICVLTVLMETWSDRAMSGRVRFVGRNRSTRSSLGLSSSGCGRRSRSMRGAGVPRSRSMTSTSKRAVRRLVAWEGVEELARVVHGEREDQPIWFSGRERGFGCGQRRRSIAQS